MPRWWPLGHKDVDGKSEDVGRRTLGPGRLIRHYCVFVSSADDVIDQRNMVEGLVNNSVNPVLATNKHTIRLEAEMWEKAHSRRLFGRETIDNEFVEKAKASDLVLAMLYERLGGGTKKEIEAVLTTKTPLSLLWFVTARTTRRPLRRDTSGGWRSARELRHKRAGRPGEPQNAEAITQVLFTLWSRPSAGPSRTPVPDFDQTQLMAEITAALIWDLPALRAGSKSAQDFAKALEGELEKWWEPRRYGPGPLGQAAQAVAAERAGEPAQALPVYNDLAAADDDWVRLLGRMLLAWSETGDDSDAVARARQAVEEIAAPDELRARLQAKVATFALDTGQHDLAREALSRAVGLAPKGTRLYSHLAFEAANAGLGRPDVAAFPEEGKPLAPDPLVDYPWIHYTAWTQRSPA
jgi:hypothetical protein